MFFPLRPSVFLGKSQIKLRFLPNLSLAESNVIHVNKNVGLCLYPNVCILDIRFRPWSRLLRQFHLFVNAGSEFKNIHYNEGHIQKHLWVEEINQFEMFFHWLRGPQCDGSGVCLFPGCGQYHSQRLFLVQCYTVSTFLICVCKMSDCLCLSIPTSLAFSAEF